MTNEEAIKNDEKYLFDEMMDLIKDEFDERDEAYNIGVYTCIDILTKFNFNNVMSVLFDSIQENTKLKSEIEAIMKALERNNEYIKTVRDENKTYINFLESEIERVS